MVEKQWRKLLEKNTDWKLKMTKTSFRPYGMDYMLLVLDKAKVKIWSENRAQIRTIVYIVQGQRESLLGRLACEALGIIKVTLKGDTVRKSEIRRVSIP